MKLKSVLADACMVAGASVGVGFLSGKESQIFLGGCYNIVVFGISFFVFCAVVRKFCRARHCADVGGFTQMCFGKNSDIFFAAACMCCFVCAVSALSGLEECSEIFLPDFALPAYSVSAAIISAFVIKKGLRALKILNIIQMFAACAYILTICFVNKNTMPQSLNVSVAESVKYALFNVTVSVGVLAPHSTDEKQNLAATAIATLMLCLLLCAVTLFADFSEEIPFFAKSNSVLLNIFCAVTLSLATVTSVAANLLPVTQFVNSVVRDESLSVLCVFCSAVTFSMFGFDFALKVGYTAVAIFGAVIIAMCFWQLRRRKATPKNRLPEV